jgi:hypothetical protein
MISSFVRVPAAGVAPGARRLSCDVEITPAARRRPASNADAPRTCCEKKARKAGGMYDVLGPSSLAGIEAECSPNFEAFSRASARWWRRG